MDELHDMAVAWALKVSPQDTGVKYRIAWIAQRLASSSKTLLAETEQTKIMVSMLVHFQSTYCLPLTVERIRKDYRRNQSTVQ